MVHGFITALSNSKNKTSVLPVVAGYRKWHYQVICLNQPDMNQKMFFEQKQLY
jgi:hypothetical protein